MSTEPTHCTIHDMPYGPRHPHSDCRRMIADRLFDEECRRQKIDPELERARQRDEERARQRREAPERLGRLEAMLELARASRDALRDVPAGKPPDFDPSKEPEI